MDMSIALPWPLPFLSLPPNYLCLSNLFLSQFPLIQLFSLPLMVANLSLIHNAKIETFIIMTLHNQIKANEDNKFRNGNMTREL